MRTAFEGALTLTSATLLALTLGLDPASRRVPLVVVVPLTILLAVLTWHDARRPRRDETPPAAGLRAALAWTAALPLLIVTAGMVTGSALYVLVAWRVRARTSWLAASVAAAVAGLGLDALLVRLVNAPVPRGILFELLRR